MRGLAISFSIVLRIAASDSLFEFLLGMIDDYIFVEPRYGQYRTQRLAAAPLRQYSTGMRPFVTNCQAVLANRV